MQVPVCATALKYEAVIWVLATVDGTSNNSVIGVNKLVLGRFILDRKHLICAALLIVKGHINYFFLGRR